MKYIRAQDSIDPTPERQRMGQIIQVETINAGVMTHIDIRSTLLDRYWRDHLLLGDTSDYELAATRHEAGQRLQMLYEDCGVRQRQMGVYGPRSHAHEEMTDEQAAAFTAYQGVIRRLTAISPSIASAVINLCIHDFDPVDRKDLIRGLDMLIRHWGLS